MSNESSYVALCLSAVARLFIAFERSAAAHSRQALLQAAGDVLDRTLPYPEVKTLLQSSKNQVQTLVENRARIGAVPAGLWRKDKVSASDLGDEHYRGWRALERVLRKDTAHLAQAWPALEAWLAPAWERYPELKSESLAAQSNAPKT